MASCRYCGIAHTNTEPHCASCGAPKSPADIHWLRSEERKAAFAELKLELTSKEGKGLRRLPAWGWVLLVFFFSPILMPMAFLLIVLLFSLGWFAIPVIAGALFVGVQTGVIPWKGIRD